MKGKRLKAAAVVFAISGMAGQAWAETVCAGAQDLTALQVASVQQQLMVAALSCEVDDVTLYNSFVSVYQQELVTSDEALQAYFLRRAPGTGTDDYNSFKTRLANNSSLSSGGDRPQESLSFNFTKVMMTDVGLGAKNDEGQPATVGYDLGLGNVL